MKVVDKENGLLKGISHFSFSVISYYASIMLTFAEEIVSTLAKYFNKAESKIEYIFWRAAAFGGWKLFQISQTVSKMQSLRKQTEIIVMFYRVFNFL